MEVYHCHGILQPRSQREVIVEPEPEAILLFLTMSQALYHFSTTAPNQDSEIHRL